MLEGWCGKMFFLLWWRGCVQFCRGDRCSRWMWWLLVLSMWKWNLFSLIILLCLGRWLKVFIIRLFMVLNFLLENFELKKLLKVFMGVSVLMMKLLLGSGLMQLFFLMLCLFLILLMICFSMFSMVIRLVMLLYLLMMMVMWLWLVWNLWSSMLRCLDLGMKVVGCSSFLMLKGCLLLCRISGRRFLVSSMFMMLLRFLLIIGQCEWVVLMMVGRNFFGVWVEWMFIICECGIMMLCICRLVIWIVFLMMDSVLLFSSLLLWVLCSSLSSFWWFFGLWVKVWVILFSQDLCLLFDWFLFIFFCLVVFCCCRCMDWDDLVLLVIYVLVFLFFLFWCC